MKLLSKPNPKDGWYEIPPSEAQKILEDQGRNRPLSEWWASILAEDIASGEYEMNGEPLIFDESGVLLDGQHRLRACVIANKPLRTYVVFGVPRKFFDTLDQGRKRTAGHVEAMAGTHHANATAAVVKKIIEHDVLGERYGNEKFRRGVPPWQVRAFMRKHKPDVEASVGLVKGYQAKLGKSLPPAAVGFVHYRAAKKDPGKASAWLHALATMEGLSMKTGGSAILLLRRRLTKAIETGEKVDASERTALLAKTWLAFHNDDPIAQLRWARGEKFPAI